MQSLALTLGFLAAVAHAQNVLAPQDILELSASPAASPSPEPEPHNIVIDNKRYTAYEMELIVQKEVEKARVEAYAKTAADKKARQEAAAANLVAIKAAEDKRERDIKYKIGKLQEQSANLRKNYEDFKVTAQKKEFEVTDAIAKQTDSNDKGKLSSSNAITGTKKQAKFEEDRLKDLISVTEGDLKKAKEMEAYARTKAGEAKTALKKALAAQNEGFKKEKEKANQLVDGILKAAKGRTDALESQIANKKTKLAYYKEEALEANNKAKSVRQELDKEILEKIKAQEAAVVAAAMATEKYALKLADQKAKIAMVKAQISSKSKELEEGKQFVLQWNCKHKDMPFPSPGPAPDDIEASPSPGLEDDAEIAAKVDDYIRNDAK